MTVRELERELLLGQKWAVDVSFYGAMEDGTVGIVGNQTFHYNTSKPVRCPYFDCEIGYIRSVGNEIVAAIDFPLDR